MDFKFLNKAYQIMIHRFQKFLRQSFCIGLQCVFPLTAKTTKRTQRTPIEIYYVLKLKVPAHGALKEAVL